jgi:outer membrane protein assembly factor BamE (lipoprotein component of BamABCDE complex)
MTSRIRYKRQSKARLAATCSAFVIVAGLMACDLNVANHGHMPDPERVEEIQIGASNRDDVELILGSPSSVAAFDSNVWYYISNKTEEIAFFHPQLLDQQVLEIHFDEGGTVSEVRHIEQADGKEVELVERETPTRGNDLTVIRQMLSSMGFLGRDPLKGPPVYKSDGRNN